jgi:AcrR family transcriptional regulator
MKAGSHLSELSTVLGFEMSKSQKTQAAIVQATVQCVADLGIEGITFDQIARASKKSRPLVMHYFKDRTALFEAVFKVIRHRFQNRVVESMAQAKTPQSQIDAYVHSCFKWVTEDEREAKAWLVFYLLCSKEAHYRKINTELVDVGWARMQTIISALQPKKSSAETLLLARMLQQLITSGLLTCLTEKRAPAEVEKQTVRMINLILRA